MNANHGLFWVVCGGLVLVLTVLAVLVLLPRRENLDRMIQSIAQRQNRLATLREAGIPGPQDLAKWERHRVELIKKTEDLIKFYQGEELKFEAWFEGLECEPYRTPNMGDFLAKWEKNKEDVNNEARDGSGYKWEEASETELANAGNAQTRYAIMKDCQKAFWVRQRICDALKPIVEREKDAKRPTEVLEVGWLESVYARFPAILKLPSGYPSPAAVASTYAGIPVAREFLIPGELGKAMTVGMTLKMRLPDLPRFIAALLSPEMLIELIGIRLEPADVNPFNRIVNVPLDDPKAFPDEQKKLSPQPVTVRLTARVLDFEKSKLDERFKALEEARAKP